MSYCKIHDEVYGIYCRKCVSEKSECIAFMKWFYLTDNLPEAPTAEDLFDLYSQSKNQPAVQDAPSTEDAMVEKFKEARKALIHCQSSMALKIIDDIIIELEAPVASYIDPSEARRNIPEGMDDWCEAHQLYYEDECPECADGAALQEAREMASEAGMSQKDFDRQQVPKMSDELAAQSDIAALEYGRDNGQNVCREEYDYDNSADLTDAHEAGQSWMYRKLQPEITQLLTDKEALRLERNEIRQRWEDVQDDRDIWKELYERTEKNIVALTNQLNGKVQ